MRHFLQTKLHGQNQPIILLPAGTLSTDSGLFYPVLLEESMFWAKDEDAPVGAGTGGIKIEIRDFKEN